jgi:hypothetical protein
MPMMATTASPPAALHAAARLDELFTAWNVQAHVRQVRARRSCLGLLPRSANAPEEPGATHAAELPARRLLESLAQASVATAKSTASSAELMRVVFTHTAGRTTRTGWPPTATTSSGSTVSSTTRCATRSPASANPSSSALPSPVRGHGASPRNTASAIPLMARILSSFRPDTTTPDLAARPGLVSSDERQLPLRAATMRGRSSGIVDQVRRPFLRRATGQVATLPLDISEQRRVGRIRIRSVPVGQSSQAHRERHVEEH